MMGKHSEQGLKIKQLEETIALKDKEIKDIKFSVADILLRIRNINESNNYSDPSVKRRKISELCTDTRYELLIDEIDGFFKKDNQHGNAKIIELPNTDQYSNTQNLENQEKGRRIKWQNVLNVEKHMQKVEVHYREEIIKLKYVRIVVLKKLLRMQKKHLV